MSDLTPRTNDILIGHAEAEAQLIHDFASGKLAHGWIITGPRGIGKATLAYRFARALLSSPSPGRGEGRGEDDSNAVDSALAPSLTLPPAGGGENVERRIAAGSHAGLLVIEPLYDEKKEEFARDIPVDQARQIGQFFSLTAGEGGWRVVIIDTADALNANAANAILKILEEPPSKSVILLICNNTGKLLPTLRSRCRMLKLKPLDKSQFTSVIRHVSPAMDGSELKILAQLSAGSPGVALEMQGQGAMELYSQIVELLADLPALDTLKLHAFADRVGTGTVHANWQMLTRLMLCLLERACKQASGADIEPITEAETQTLARLAALHPAPIWAAKWQQCADQFLLAESRHLDYKQVILAFFHSIAGKEGFQIGNAA